MLSFLSAPHAANTKLDNAIAAKPLTNLFTFIDSHLFFHDFHKHQKFVIHYIIMVLKRCQDHPLKYLHFVFSSKLIVGVNLLTIKIYIRQIREILI